MNTTDRELVKQSWKSLQKVEPLVIGDLFYTKLFIEYPPLQHLFTISKVQQAQKLIDTLAAIVENLDTLEQMTEVIQGLARRHAGYGVKPEQYDMVGRILLWTLRTVSPPDWNPEVEKAWSNCYGLLADTMIKAAYK